MFAGFEITSSKEAKLTAESGELLHISQACLTEDSANGKNYLQLHIRGQTLNVACLSKNGSESTNLDLFINVSDETNPVALRLKGSGKMHVTGYYEPQDPEMDEMDEDTFAGMQGLQAADDSDEEDENEAPMESIPQEDDEDSDDEEVDSDEASEEEAAPPLNFKKMAQQLNQAISNKKKPVQKQVAPPEKMKKVNAPINKKKGKK